MKTIGCHAFPAGRMRAGMACGLTVLLTGVAAAGGAQPVLRVGSAPKPIPIPYFPSRMHAFVWRNWETADLSRMAEVLATSTDNVRAVGRSMGLPEHQPISELQHQRGYISVIRRNWHLLNYDQLLTLLGWDAEELAYTLKEDDFLWVKLGMLKPDAEPLEYAPPSPSDAERCAEIAAIVQSEFGRELAEPMEPRFAFVEALSAPMDNPPPIESPDDDEPIRFLYSYFAVYGDPLLNPELDPYPDGLLQRLAANGVNGVWLHTVLRQLAPSDAFPEFGKGHETRLANLRRLCARAGTYGIKVYLYMNEPRSMPASFFEDHPDIAGVEERGNLAMCSSVPAVRQWMADSLAHLFTEVPELGGVFTITASENLTNCYSRTSSIQCPRCSKREPADVVAEVNVAIAEGVRRGNPDATVICWDWGWRDEWAEDIIRQLPDDVYLMSVSEWSKPITRGGVSTEVGEYSLSAVGPGPRATRHWAWAKERGLRTMAKVQVNCTWELSAVPYIPVMNLVGQHMANLTRAGTSGTMLSWTLGGYPSPNLELVRQFQSDPPPSLDEALQTVAESRFGKQAAPHALKAWTAFSEAFAEFPFHVGYLYAGPSQVGPANPLYFEPTGYHATMVGFPYDAVDQWRAVYPRDVFVGQFEKIATGWLDGLAYLRQVEADAGTDEARGHAREDLRIAEAAYCHLKSVANQARFTVAREMWRAASEGSDGKSQHLKIMRDACRSEIDLAKHLFALTREDSRIGFEASNHYYYYPLDLVEKVINCRDILDRLGE